jgi:hypothetical protein
LSKALTSFWISCEMKRRSCEGTDRAEVIDYSSLFYHTLTHTHKCALNLELEHTHTHTLG